MQAIRYKMRFNRLISELDLYLKNKSMKTNLINKLKFYLTGQPWIKV